MTAPPRRTHRTLPNPPRLATCAAALAMLAVLAACGDTAKLQVSEGTGPNPRLPEPTRGLLPTVQVAEAVGWADGQQPQAATGLQVQAFARGLDHPRWLYTLPNGDVLVAESNSPADAKEPSGPRAWAMALFMTRAGAKVPSADRITLLRDTDRDGRADMQVPFLTGLHSPFGMALVNGQLYIANTDAVVRVPYRDGDTHASAAPTTVVSLPALPINHHWTKNLLAHPDGNRLYVSIGSNSNVADNGMDVEAGRAAIDEVLLSTGQRKPFATGLRNPNGMAWVPGSQPVLWTVVNERDELGSDLVPDYLTSVQPGAFYGWPYSYYGAHVDARVQPQQPDLVASAVTPDYALGPHTASLGLQWLTPGPLHTLVGNGMVIGQHGSWNRKPPSGYRVVFVPFTAGKPSGPPVTLLDGFLSADGKQARGRPVGVTQDALGALLVADDVGNTVWRVQVAAGAPATPR